MSPPQSWPVDIQRTLGIGVWTISGFLAITGLTQILPVALKSRGLGSFVEQGGAFWIIASALITAFLLLFGRRPASLKINEEGIFFTLRKSAWRYAWPDIERAVETNTGIRLILKGRSDSQNKLNAIPSGFGLKPSELERLVAWGVAHYGSVVRTTTVAQGDDLKKATAAGTSLTMGLLAIVFGGIFVMLSISTLRTAADDARLQKTGAQTMASVSRVFSSGCGKHSCRLFADYSYVAEDPNTGTERTFSGTGKVGNDDNLSDPDLIYVKTTRAVPIAYDKTNPGFSRVNLRNEIFSRDPWKFAARMIAILFGVTVVPAVVFVTILLLVSRVKGAK